MPLSRDLGLLRILDADALTLDLGILRDFNMPLARHLRVIGAQSPLARRRRVFASQVVPLASRHTLVGVCQSPLTCRRVVVGVDHMPGARRDPVVGVRGQSALAGGDAVVGVDKPSLARRLRIIGSQVALAGDFGLLCQLAMALAGKLGLFGQLQVALARQLRLFGQLEVALTGELGLLRVARLGARTHALGVLDELQKALARHLCLLLELDVALTRQPRLFAQPEVTLAGDLRLFRQLAVALAGGQRVLGVLDSAPLAGGDAIVGVGGHAPLAGGDSVLSEANLALASRRAVVWVRDAPLAGGHTVVRVGGHAPFSRGDPIVRVGRHTALTGGDALVGVGDAPLARHGPLLVEETEPLLAGALDIVAIGGDVALARARHVLGEHLALVAHLVRERRRPLLQRLRLQVARALLGAASSRRAALLALLAAALVALLATAILDEQRRVGPRRKARRRSRARARHSGTRRRLEVGADGRRQLLRLLGVGRRRCLVEALEPAGGGDGGARAPPDRAVVVALGRRKVSHQVARLRLRRGRARLAHGRLLHRRRTGAGARDGAVVLGALGLLVAVVAEECGEVVELLGLGRAAARPLRVQPTAQAHHRRRLAHHRAGGGEPGADAVVAATIGEARARALGGVGVGGHAQVADARPCRNGKVLVRHVRHRRVVVQWRHQRLLELALDPLGLGLTQLRHEGGDLALEGGEGGLQFLVLDPLWLQLQRRDRLHEGCIVHVAEGVEVAAHGHESLKKAVDAAEAGVVEPVGDTRLAWRTRVGRARQR